MTTKADFTTEEWDALLSGPLAASIYIIVASPSVFGSIKEVTAMTKELAKAVSRPDNTELLRFMLADYQDKDTIKRVMPETKGNPDEVKAALSAYIEKTVSLLNEKATPEESSQIRAWMMDLAVTVAEASREGGFLGIHAVRVSDAEKQALAELADVLDVTEPDIAAGATTTADDASTQEAAADETSSDSSDDAGSEDASAV